MKDRLYTYPSGEVRLLVPRGVGIRMAMLLLLAAIIAVSVLFVVPGKPTPTVAGLRQIPSSALAQLKTRLGIDGRRHVSESPAGSLKRSLTGAALLDRAEHRLRLEVSTQYYFHLKGKPPRGAPAGWAGETENYSVAFIRTSPDRWQVASIKLLPQPQVHEG